MDGGVRMVAKHYWRREDDLSGLVECSLAVSLHGGELSVSISPCISGAYACS